MTRDEPPRPEPLLLTIKEAAAILDVPAAPLRRGAEQHGFLILFGRHARIRRTDLDALVDAMRAPPRKGSP